MSDAMVGILGSLIAAWALFLGFLFGGLSIAEIVRRNSETESARKKNKKRGSLRRILMKGRKALKKSIRQRKPSFPPNLSLWEKDPVYPVALAHRCLKDPRKRNLRVFLSYYSDGTVLGRAKSHGRDRLVIDLGGNPDLSDAEWLDLAKSSKPDDSFVQPRVSRGSSDLCNLVRPAEMHRSNQWIWTAGAFDHKTDKASLARRMLRVS